MFRTLLFLPLLVVMVSCNQSISYSVESPRTVTPIEKSAPPKYGKGILERGGKCYKNCVVPDRYETVWVSFPMYTGSDHDAPLRVENLVLEPPKQQWVEKNTGEICLVETPAQIKAVRVLADTFYYKEFRLERFKTKKLAEKGGFLRETEVVCSDERTPNLFLQISAALKTYGYMEEAKTQWDNKFSQAIQQFQKDNSLPVGDLNLATLEFLGI